MDFWLTVDQNPDLKEYEHEYARLWKDTRRIVFSKTMDKVQGKAKLFREVDPEEIIKLKKQSGNNMGVEGANLALTFIKHGLVDEFRLYIHPVALGGGKPMFPIHKKLNLKFVETETFSCGVVMLISENIRIHSIIGRFLEHSRCYYFRHGGEDLYFIGSADWMHRNLDARVEVLTPIEHLQLKKYLQFVFNIYLTDNQQRWVMKADGAYQRVKPKKDKEKTGTHQYLMGHTKSFCEPIPKSSSD